MKLLTVLFLVVLVKTEFVVCTNNQNSNEDVNNNITKGLLDININTEVDQVLNQVRVFLKENGFDPTDLPNHQQEFSVKGMFTHYGRLTLTKGWMQDIRTIARSANAYMRIKPVLKAHVKVPIIIPNLEFGYDYKVKFGITRRSGGIIGNVEHYQLYVYAVYDVVRKKIKFNQFDTTDIGKITVKLTGKTWTDWWMNAFIDAVTDTIHDDIVQVVNTTLSVVANKIADVINNGSYNIDPEHFMLSTDSNSSDTMNGNVI